MIAEQIATKKVAKKKIKHLQVDLQKKRLYALYGTCTVLSEHNQNTDKEIHMLDPFNLDHIKSFKDKDYSIVSFSTQKQVQGLHTLAILFKKRRIKLFRHNSNDEFEQQMVVKILCT